MFTRLYTGEDGQSHFEEIDMEVGQFPWGELKTATGIMFRKDDPGKFIDWHPAPRRQFIVTLSGRVEIGLGDGTIRQFGRGDVMLADDTTGHGHTTLVVGDVIRISVAIPID